MSSKDFAYYVKDLPDEDQKALKLSSPNHWLDFTIAFILCLRQLGLLGDSGDPVEERPPPTMGMCTTKFLTEELKLICCSVSN